MISSDYFALGSITFWLSIPMCTSGPRRRWLPTSPILPPASDAEEHSEKDSPVNGTSTSVALLLSDSW